MGWNNLWVCKGQIAVGCHLIFCNKCRTQITTSELLSYYRIMQLGNCNWKLNQDSSYLSFNWGANILFGYQIPQRIWNRSPHAQSTKEISENWFCNSWTLSLTGREKNIGKRLSRDGSCYVLSLRTHPERGIESILCHLSLDRSFCGTSWWSGNGFSSVRRYRGLVPASPLRLKSSKEGRLRWCCNWPYSPVKAMSIFPEEQKWGLALCPVRWGGVWRDTRNKMLEMKSLRTSSWLLFGYKDSRKDISALKIKQNEKT